MRVARIEFAGEARAAQRTPKDGRVPPPGI